MAKVKEAPAKANIRIPDPNDPGSTIVIDTNGYITLEDQCTPPCVLRIMDSKTALDLADALQTAKDRLAVFEGIKLPKLPRLDYTAEVFLVDEHDNKLRGTTIDFSNLHIHIGCRHISAEILTEVIAAVKKQLDL